MKNVIKKRLSLVVFAALLLSFVPIYALQARAAQLTTWESVVTGSFQENQSEGITSYTLYKSNGESETVTIDTGKTPGDKQNPIGISSETELILFGQQTSDTSGKYYILDKPGGVYDMQGDERTMLPLFKMAATAGDNMPSSGNPFKGTLIGGGATIKNAKISDYSDTAAYTPSLFGKLDGGVVTGITLEGCTFYCNNSVNNTVLPAGALVAHLSGGAVINCGETGSTFTNIGAEAAYFGGLVGYAGNSSAILNCYATSNASSTVDSANVGGLVGYSTGTVQTCYAAGVASGGSGASTGAVVGSGTAATASHGKDVGVTITNQILNTNNQGGGTAYAEDGDTLLETLNAWVTAQSSKDYEDWAQHASINGGYPYFGFALKPPFAPGGLTATPGDGQVTLNWTTPPSGIGAITKYQLSYGETSSYSQSWQDISGSNSSTVSHTVTGLTNGTEYTFEVRAVNAAGNGASSGAVAATPVAPPPIYDPPPPPEGGFTGGGNTYRQGSGMPLVHTSDKAFSDFSRAGVDNKTLTRDKDYSAESGSTVITIFPKYLDTLSTGTHTLSVQFTDGSAATAEFEVIAPWVNPFGDVSEDDWFYDDVMFVYNRGLMNGTGDGEFSPNGKLSRAMLVTILARLAGEDLTGSEPWYEKALEWGVENGITDGTNPHGDITREQLATMLYRYMGSPELKAGQLEFPDAGEMSDWAFDALVWAVYEGIIEGRTNGLLDPGGDAKRAEAAAVLTRLIQLLPE